MSVHAYSPTYFPKDDPFLFIIVTEMGGCKPRQLEGKMSLAHLKWVWNGSGPKLLALWPPIKMDNYLARIWMWW